MSSPSFKDLERHSALPDLEDKRDYLMSDMIGGVIELPETFLIKGQSKVKNQFSRGTCTAFAGCAILEYLEGQENNVLPDLSEEYLFKRTKEYDVADYGYDGYGAYLRSAAKAMTHHGACLEATMPYIKTGEGTWKTETTTDLQDFEAYLYHTKSYASVGGRVDSLKTALFVTNTPLLMGITLYKNYRESQTTGILPMPDGDVVGGHCMELVGWNETHYIVKNSWNGWGGDGYLRIPFDYRMFTSWSFIDYKNPFLTTKMRAYLAMKVSAKFMKWQLKRIKKFLSLT